MYSGNDSRWNQRVYKSNRSQMFFNTNALKNLPIFTRKHLYWSLRPTTLLKRDSNTGAFPWILQTVAAFWQSNQSKIFQKIISSKLRNSISVDKVCALKRKQKSTAGTFHGISRNFRTANFEKNFGGCFWKESRGDAQWPLRFQVFNFSWAVAC